MVMAATVVCSAATAVDVLTAVVAVAEAAQLAAGDVAVIGGPKQRFD